ncbi:unnamed protein product, partial [Mesorhabditis spiculigera]
MRCFEGLDCEENASCNECIGVACTRVTTLDPESNGVLALTCLPFDTREYGGIEQDGCRTQGLTITCICQSHDYCNPATQPLFLISIILVLLFILWRRS